LPKKIFSSQSRREFVFIKNNPKRKYKGLITKEEINSLQKSWDIVESKYFKILESITQKPIFSQNFSCFWTTGFMCPYNQKENWFMVSFWHSTPFSITTICHEIMHLQFLHYYQKYLKKKGLKDNQIEDLKEALTFLLNESGFEEIILVNDFGYPEHKELRKKLKSVWLKDKNFKNLVDKAVLLIK